MFFLLGTTGVLVHLLAGDARMRGYPSLKDRLLVILLWQHLVRLAAPSTGQVRHAETFKGVSIMHMALKVSSSISFGVNPSLPIRETTTEGLLIREHRFGAESSIEAVGVILTLHQFLL